MAVGDMFELRVEFQDLIVDVALSMPCSCADALNRARAEGTNDARACLGCRALYVMQLGRRIRGWGPWPAIGIRHTAGQHFRSVEVTTTPGGRRRAPRVVDGRQVCVNCGEILARGAHSLLYREPGEVVVKYGPRTTPLGVVVAAGLTGRDPREAAPGSVECFALLCPVPLQAPEVGASAREAGRALPGQHSRTGARRPRPRRPGRQDRRLG